jgi:triacylglycerol lipase
MRLRTPRWFAALSPRRRLVVGITLLVVAALAAFGGLRAAQRGDATAPADPGAGPVSGATAGVSASPGAPGSTQAGPTAVVLVPGYGGNTHSLTTLAAHLRAAGDAATIVALPSGGTGDLQAQADALNGYVDRALRAGARTVDVIGYSAGGVVARLWDVEHDGADKVRRIITLGAPLHGAELAAVGAAVDPSACPVACQQLVPGSAFLTRLDQIPLTGRPGWLSLYTLDDQTVRPPTSARLAGAVNVPLQGICPGAVIQHGQLPSSPLVIGIVLRALSQRVLTAPAATDCGPLRSLGGAGSPTT